MHSPTSSYYHVHATESDDEDFGLPSASLEPTTLWQRRIVTWGWLFDAIAVVIYLSNAVTDVWVTIESILGGSMMGVQMGIALAVGCCVNVGLLVEETWRKKLGVEFFRPLQFLLVLPLAPIIPAVLLLLYRFHPYLAHFSQFEIKDERETDEPVGAVAEETAAVASDLMMMDWIRGRAGLELEMHSAFQWDAYYLLFYQLFSVAYFSFHDGPPTLLVVSVLLSVHYHIVRGCLLSSSMTVKISLFKVLCLVCDLFTLSYSFFSAFSSNSQKHDVWIGSMAVSYLTMIWLLRILVYAIFCIIAVAAREWLDPRNRSKPISDRLIIVFYAFLFITFSGAPFIAEGAKWSWLVPLMYDVEPCKCKQRGLALARSFIHRGGGGSDDRLRFIAKQVYAEKNFMRDQKEAAGESLLAAELSEVLDASLSYLAALRGEFGSHGLFSKLFRRFKENVHPLRCDRQSALTAGKVVGISLYAVSQMYGFVFPFIMYAINYSSQSLLQHIFFVGMSLSLLGLLLLSPTTHEYVCFCLDMETFGRAFRHNSQLEVHVKRWISNYYVPKHSCILTQCVPTELVPRDVVGEVGEFLDNASLDLRDLTIRDCTDIKEAVVEQTVMASDIEEVLHAVMAKGDEMGVSLTTEGHHASHDHDVELHALDEERQGHHPQQI